MPSALTLCRIESIGLELEGGWETRPPTEVHRDGSVVDVRGSIVGEVSSPVLTSLTEAEEWLQANYPTSVNRTCGFHVHIGVNKLSYSCLMETDFEAFFYQAMEEFYQRQSAARDDNSVTDCNDLALLRHRMDGNNEYCQKRFQPEAQLWRTEAYGERNAHPRYRQLNFAYLRHGTVECRLFPCFHRPTRARDALHAFLNCVETYLARTEPAQPVKRTLTVKKSLLSP